MTPKKIIILLLALAFISTSCVTKSKYLELDGKYRQCMSDFAYTNSEKIDFENKSKDLTSEVASLKMQIASLKEDSAALGRRMRIVERNLAKTKGDYDDLLKSFTDQNLTKNALLAEKEARLNELQAVLDQKDAEVKALRNKVANALKGFEDMGLTIYEKNGKVYVSLDEKLLFASGSWDIDNRGKEALAELGKVLAHDQNINVVIEGHTDHVPYRGSGNVKDNWDLSVMRATSVVKEILKNNEINPQRITASGRSEFLPIEMDDSREARAKNRRTEIILTPKLDELFQIIDNQ
ncbi:MAG: OmpA family protein [Lentimicrobiaceae bacterium]|nr:OmpA family protein [Lentimicrobiaceae bacterium]